MPNPTVRQAIHKLDFIIVGGSITGLATGFGLARSGHRVHIFEQMPEIVRECAGVRIPPNATALLKKWGLEEDIRRVSSAVLSSTCMDLNSGEPVGLVPWGEDLVQELGSRWYALNYRDLVEILYRAALRCGVRVATSARVTSVNPPPQGGTEPRPSITLEDGRTFHAHVVLGADGVYSSVRASIEEEPPQAESHGIAVYSGLVPIEAIDSDPRIPDIRNSTPIWCGTNQSVVVNAASPGFCSFTLFWDDAKNEPDTWDLAIPSSSLSIHSAPVPDCVKRLVSATDRVARQKYDIWPSFEDLVDQTGTIAVLGDAARPTALLGNNTTSNPIESAAVIATLFSYIRGLDQIPVILNAYEDILRAREDTFTKAEHLQRQITLSPPGPQRDAIRATLASGWEGISLEDQWNQISQLWAYDAIDAANDWWINWGVLRERALFANAPGAETPGRFDELHVSVTAH